MAFAKPFLGWRLVFGFVLVSWLTWGRDAPRHVLSLQLWAFDLLIAHTSWRTLSTFIAQALSKSRCKNDTPVAFCSTLNEFLLCWIHPATKYLHVTVRQNHQSKARLSGLWIAKPQCHKTSCVSAFQKMTHTLPHFFFQKTRCCPSSICMYRLRDEDYQRLAMVEKAHQ